MLKEHPHFPYVGEYLLTSSPQDGHILERETNINPFYRQQNWRLSVVKSLNQIHRGVNWRSQDLNYHPPPSKACVFPSSSCYQVLPTRKTTNSKISFLKQSLSQYLDPVCSASVNPEALALMGLNTCVPHEVNVPGHWVVFT